VTEGRLLEGFLYDSISSRAEQFEARELFSAGGKISCKPSLGKVETLPFRPIISRTGEKSELGGVGLLAYE
jgi:hypothetical protein